MANLITSSHPTRLDVFMYDYQPKFLGSLHKTSGNPDIQLTATYNPQNFICINDPAHFLFPEGGLGMDNPVFIYSLDGGPIIQIGLSNKNTGQILYSDNFKIKFAFPKSIKVLRKEHLNLPQNDIEALFREFIMPSDLAKILNSKPAKIQGAKA